MTGAPREAYASQDFIIVHKDYVRLLGSWELAGCFQRIAWRAERDGYWRATMAEIAEEICVSERTAKRLTAKLRDAGWLTSERDNSHDSTLTWTPVFAGSATVALPGETAGQHSEGQVGTPGSDQMDQGGAKLALSQEAKLALPSSKTGDPSETLSTPTADAAGTDDAPVRRDLNEGREDVDRLCEHLSSALAEHQVKHTVTKSWRDAARLAIDVDGHSEAQMHRMIDWCQRDDFWHQVIHSMPTLRAKYDKMRQKAAREYRSGPVDNRHRGTDESRADIAGSFAHTG